MTNVFQDVRNAIVARIIESGESGELGAVTIAHDNDDFVAPAPAAAWMRFSVRNGTSVQETIGQVGSRWFTRYGYIYANIYAPLGSANSVLDGIASSVLSLYMGGKLETVPLDGGQSTTIRFSASSFEEQDVPEGKYFEGTLRINFNFEQLL